MHGGAHSKLFVVEMRFAGKNMFFHMLKEQTPHISIVYVRSGFSDLMDLK